jgi:hypothetical protein
MVDPEARHSSFASRLRRAALLDGSVFSEAKHDPRALPQAVAVVLLAGLARGIGVLPEEGALGIAAGILGGLIFWGVTAATVDWIGVALLRGHSTFGELLRTLGFAAAPLLLLAFQILPWSSVKSGVWFAAHGLATLALGLAVRGALESSPQRALVVCLAAITVGLLLVSGASTLLFGWLSP